ncbi:TRIM2_3 [Mytilus coruscus]|uniref:TRIM2_3 n=1 Tax=Mytilus coruscus TaxID=42192 RepID=A0A6J8D6S6_MYTCO|nr:TRIM2_3 [Mytilus coruscus]
MDSNSEEFCGICYARHITKSPNFWCSDCDEGLCTECHEHHSISKSSRNHNVIPMESYNKLPSSIANIVNYCTNHGRKYENYCPHHEKLCCPACISIDHRSCIGLLLLQDVLKTAKTSVLLNSIESDIRDIKSNIEKIIQDRQQNLAIIHDQRNRYRLEMKQVRTTLNSHLDTLEQNILQDLDANENKVKRETEKLITKLLEKTKVTDDLVRNISAIKMHATDIQAFIGSKAIETRVEKEEQYLQGLTEDGSLSQILLKLNINKTLSNMKSNIKYFGNVTLETSQSLVVLKRTKTKQAQNTLNDQYIVQKPIYNITLFLLSKITIPVSMVRSWLLRSFDLQGISVLRDEKLILADSYYKRLLIVNNDGMVDMSISCPTVGNGPFGVTYIENNLVAISTSQGIQTVNTQTGSVVGNIATNGECRGIAFNNGTVICWVKSIGIQSIQLSNLSTKTLVKIEENSNRLGIAVHRNKIYATEFSNDAVSCYTFEGRKLWQFQNKFVLKGPTGIAIDNNCNIYVAAYKCVLCLSSGGKKFKKFEASKDGFSDPTALYFDCTKNKLIVANKGQPVFVYHVA